MKNLEIFKKFRKSKSQSIELDLEKAVEKRYNGWFVQRYYTKQDVKNSCLGFFENDEEFIEFLNFRAKKQIIKDYDEFLTYMLKKEISEIDGFYFQLTKKVYQEISEYRCNRPNR